MATLSLAPLPRRTRVIVADPYPVIVHGVRKMVEDDPRLQVVAEASNMLAFRKKLIAQDPEVALVDWSMAYQDLSVTMELLQSDRHSTSMIFLTVSENSEEKREMVRLGARGFLSKWTSARKLQKAVFKACNRRSPIEAPGAASWGADHILSTSGPDSEPQRIKRLTHRERQLLPLVCGGLKNKEIALRLGIAETTVWHHLTAIFTKLQVDDRLGLAAFVYRHHLVLPHDGPATIPIRSNNVASPSARPMRPDQAGASGSRVEPFRSRTFKHRPAVHRVSGKQTTQP